jgi:hypothetical protein
VWPAPEKATDGAGGRGRRAAQAFGAESRVISMKTKMKAAKAKRYKFQALVTLGSSRDGGPSDMQDGQVRRVVVQGHNHATGGSRFFNALVTRNSQDSLWPEGNPAVLTITLVCDAPRDYFDVGDRFTLGIGGDLGRGVVTRRLFF